MRRRPIRERHGRHITGATLAAVSWLVAALPLGALESQPPMPLVSRAVTRAADLEGRLVWVDGYANLDALASRQGIAALMESVRRARANTVVFGAKMFGGQALYPSKVAPRLSEWRGQRVPPDLDILRAVIEEAHARGLKVHAAVDVFSDGHRITRMGPAYEHPEWQTVLYTVRRELLLPDGQRLMVYAVNPSEPTGEVVTAFTPGYGWRKPRSDSPDEAQVVAILAGPAEDMRIITITECALLRDNQVVEMPPDSLLLHGRGSMAEWMLRALRIGDRAQFAAVDRFVPIGSDELQGSALFLNPVLPEVRERALQIIAEIARDYDVDGITFDRMRFSGIAADFSDYTRAEFEKAIGRKVARWPDDIVRIDPIPGRDIVRGPLFNQWIEWRALQITTFLRQAVRAIRAAKPQMIIGAYVGAWYDRYYQEGVNWASPEYAGSLDWMTATYGQTGYAKELDYITTGCYYPRATAEAALFDDAPAERTVEMASQLSSRVISDAAFFYAGLDLNQYESGLGTSAHRFDKDALRAAIATARANSQGVMIFDSVHLNRNGAWGVLEEGFSSPATAPHDVPELLAALRRVRETLRK
ncbi:MAG: family 10 glycosylhydrolase [Armatimonadetes bacterium]|nr:family 10 glycosylhydrolase [Armatimonadota bacterium]